MKNYTSIIFILFLAVGNLIGQAAPENIDVGVYAPGTYDATPPANATFEVAINTSLLFPAVPVAAELNFILQIPTSLYSGNEVFSVTEDQLGGGDMIPVPPGDGGIFEYGSDTYIVFVYNGAGINLSVYPINTWKHVFTIYVTGLAPNTDPSDFLISDSSSPLFIDLGARTALNVLGFNEFLPLSSNPSLPLELLSFEVEKFQDNSSLLKWVTVNEINTGNFLIQRSLNKTNWSTIGSVKAAGNSLNIENYSFIDVNVYNGVQNRLNVYYRLIIVDLDGKTSLSPIQKITFGKDAAKSADFTVQLFPNPASDGINVGWETGNGLQPTLLEIYDITGKLILTKKVAENSDQEYIDFGPAKMDAGVYLLRVLNGTEPIAHQQLVVGQSK